MRNVAPSERENLAVSSLRSVESSPHQSPLETHRIACSIGFRSEQYSTDDTQSPRAAAQLPPGRSPNDGPQGGKQPQQYQRPRRSKTPLLDELGDDITKRAQEGRVDPAIGRDEEIELVVQTLLRRTKGNPVLIGEPGVGKTAVVEELARQIDVGLIPELEGKRIISLSVGNLLAGTKLRGSSRRNLKELSRRRQNPPTSFFLSTRFIQSLHQEAQKNQDRTSAICSSLS